MGAIIILGYLLPHFGRFFSENSIENSNSFPSRNGAKSNFSAVKSLVKLFESAFLTNEVIRVTMSNSNYLSFGPVKLYPDFTGMNICKAIMKNLIFETPVL